MGYGRGSRGRGAYPGNGPFAHLPPWERPGWLYGRGSCWTMGYRGVVPSTAPAVQYSAVEDVAALQRQRDLLVTQIESIQKSLEVIQKRISELEQASSQE